MDGFTPYSALIGGALVGLAASALLAINGRIAGVSGILGGLLAPGKDDTAWRLAFLAGLPVGALIYGAVVGEQRLIIDASIPVLVIGGLITGLGVQLGGGCTSGHGVCGLGRLSARSLVATLTFMSTTFLTVFVVRHILAA